MITKTKQFGDPDSDLREAFKVKKFNKNFIFYKAVKLRKKLMCIIKINYF